MSARRSYLQPENTEEAIHRLVTAQGPVKVIAGGTDLLLEIQQGRHPPVHTWSM